MIRFASSPYYVLLGLALLTNACATINDSEEVLAIDSNPRGLWVRKKGNEAYFGKTPMVVRAAREREKQYQFSLSEQGDRSDPVINHDCQFRWTTSLISNLIFGIPYFGIGMIVDGLTGSGYECGPLISKKVKLGGIEPSIAQLEPCYSYLILSSEYHGRRNRESIVAEWMQRNSESLGRCDRLIPFEASESEMLKLGLEGGYNFTLKEGQHYRIFKVAERFSANRVINLKFQQSSDELTLTPEVFDLAELRKVSHVFEQIRFSNPQDQIQFYDQILSQFVASLPNSIVYQSRNFLPDRFVILESSASSGSLGVTTVLHPSRFSVFDYSLDVLPSLELIRYFGSREIEDSISRWDVSGLLASASGVATGHTPFGAFGYGFGYGMQYSFVRSEDGPSGWFFQPHFVQDLIYTAFINENWFFRLKNSRIMPFFNPSMAVDPRFIQGVSTVFEIGYFFPEMRKIISSISSDFRSGETEVWEQFTSR